MNGISRSLDAILHTEIAWTKKPQKPILGVAVDSRKVRPHDLFFAIPGEKTDGHRFIQEALQKGASAIVTQQPVVEVLPEDVGLAVVSDGLLLLQTIASLLIQACGSSVIALTGSLGKTTTREYTKALLNATACTLSPEDNCNSQIGLSLSCINTLLKAGQAPRWFVAEMGMTEKGNISKLISLFPPKVSLVTCVAPVHFHNFNTIQDVARAKAEIFASKHTASSIVNIDSACSDVLVEAVRGRFVTVSMHKKANYTLELNETACVLVRDGLKTHFKRPNLCAHHQFENLLHAMALACEAGGDVNAFHDVLEHLPVVPRRLEHIEKGGILFINDSYNAALISMTSALDVLWRAKGKRKIAVLGQMKELGALSCSSHEAVGAFARDRCDMLFCVGEECGPLVEAFSLSQKPCYWAADLQELIALLQNELRADDTVLLKGSNSNRLWTVLDHVTMR